MTCSDPTPCVVCGGPSPRRKDPKGFFHPKKCCSPACRRVTRARTLAATNRLLAPERMRNRNPMLKPECRALVSQKLRAMKHGPHVRGGNGRMTTTEWMLCDQLNAVHRGWCMRQILKTNAENGLPSGLKLDLSNPWLKVAVELSGGSHGALVRQEQDARKTAFLQAHGWKVLTFTNREVRDTMGKVVQTILNMCITLE